MDAVLIEQKLKPLDLNLIASNFRGRIQENFSDSKFIKWVTNAY